MSATVLRTDSDKWAQWQRRGSRQMVVIVDGEPFGASSCETCEEDGTTTYHDREDHDRYAGGFAGNIAPAGIRATRTVAVHVVGCPDGGRCHHACRASCFRVRTCGPLSGVFPGDMWPDNPVEVTDSGTARIEWIAPITDTTIDADHVITIDGQAHLILEEGDPRPLDVGDLSGHVGRFAALATLLTVHPEPTPIPTSDSSGSGPAGEMDVTVVFEAETFELRVPHRTAAATTDDVRAADAAGWFADTYGWNPLLHATATSVEPATS